jgi:hypothetical protein
MQTDPPNLADLWRRTRDMFARAVAAIGAPEAIARRMPLAPSLRRGIAGWIALLESIGRKLLLCDAAALRERERRSDRGPRLEIVHLRAPQPAPDAPAQAARREPPTRRALDLSAPHTWRARIAFGFPRDPLACPESRAPRIRALWGPTPPPPPPPRRAAERTPPALRLAFRLEAVRRVLEDPAPYALRLARLLKRLQRRFPELPGRYAIAAARPYFQDLADPRLVILVLAASMCAAHVFDSS